MQSGYTRELSDAVCESIAAGQTLREIARQAGMPKAPTFLLWVQSDFEGLAERYARACGIRLDVHADDIQAIGDEPMLTKVEVDRARLRIDSRKWLLSKLRPDKYGDRTAVEHSGTVNVAGALADTIRANRAKREADNEPA